MREAQSDRILNLAQVAAQIEKQIGIHTGVVVSGLVETFASIFEVWEEGQALPDFQATLRAMKDKLAGSREKLSEAEEHHIDLTRQAIGLRAAREEVTGNLYDDFSSIRRTVEELYHGKGKGNANAFVVAGIQGPTPQKPTRLLRQVDLAIGHLLQPGLEFPASRFGETRLEPAKVVSALKPSCDRLHQVLDDLSEVAVALDASRMEKNRAIDALEAMLSWVAQSAESFFEMAGKHELAERIRLATRRHRRHQAVAPGEADVDASAPVDANSGSGDEPAGDEPAGDEPAGVPPAADG